MNVKVLRFQAEILSPVTSFTYMIMFIVVLFTIDKRWNQPRYPSAREWIKKIGVCVQVEYHNL